MRRISFGKKEVNPFVVGAGLTVLATALSLSACSLKNPDQHIIRIELPQTFGNTTPSLSAGREQNRSALVVAENRNSSSAFAEGNAPASLSEFNCIAVNIKGAGIPRDDRMKCSDPNEGLHRFSGFIPVKGGVLELEIPSGPGRTIQLFGIKSSEGCHSIDYLLSPAGSQIKVDPFELASKQVDIFSDLTVEMKISYDPSNPKAQFKSCHGGGPREDGMGPSIPLTGAYRGYYETPESTVQRLFSVNPTVAKGAMEFSDSSAFTASDLTQITANVNETDPSQLNSGGGQMIGPSATYARRSVIQLQWDLTGQDLAKYPFANINLQMRGGHNGDASCPINPYNPEATGFSVASAVFHPGKGEWIPLQRFSTQKSDPNRYWGWGGNEFSQIPIDRLVFQKSDGKKYLIINVESGYVAKTAFSACNSLVRVANVSLDLRSASTQNNAYPLRIGGTAHSIPGYYGPGVQTFAVPLPASGAAMTGFYANGGVPPYRFMSSAGATTDPETGSFRASAVGTYTVTVMDAANSSATATVHVKPEDAIIGYKIALGTNITPPLIAGNCYTITATALGFNGAKTLSSSTSVIVQGDTWNPSNGVPIFADSSCTSSLTGIPINQSQANGLAYYRPTRATRTWENQMESYLQPDTGFVMNSDALFGSGFSHVILPATASQFSLKGPAFVTDSACVKYRVSLIDNFENIVNNGATAQSFSVTNSGSAAAGLFSDSNCTVSMGNGVIPPFSSTGYFYYKPTSPGSLSLGIGADAGNSIAAAYPITGTVRAASTATRLAVTAPNSAAPLSCVSFTIRTVNSFGSLVPPPAAFDAKIYGPSSSAYYASTNCTGDPLSVTFEGAQPVPYLSFTGSDDTQSFSMTAPSDGGLGIEVRDNIYELDSSGPVNVPVAY